VLTPAEIDGLFVALRRCGWKVFGINLHLAQAHEVRALTLAAWCCAMAASPARSRARRDVVGRNGAAMCGTTSCRGPPRLAQGRGVLALDGVSTAAMPARRCGAPASARAEARSSASPGVRQRQKALAGIISARCRPAKAASRCSQAVTISRPTR